MPSKKSIFALARSLALAGTAASLITACSGGSGSQTALPPQPSAPDVTVPTVPQGAGHATSTQSTTPAFSVVQVQHGGGTYSSTLTVQLSKAPVAGNVLVLFFEQNKSAAFPYSGQVTWPTLASGSQWSYDGSSDSTAVLHHVVAAGETGKYTLNVGGTGSGAEGYSVAEIAGASASNPLNAHLERSIAAGTTSFNFGSGITPTAAGTLPVAFFTAHMCCASVSWSSTSSGWTISDRNSQYTQMLATGPVQTGTAAVNATATLSKGSAYAGAADVVLLNPATATSTPTPAPTATPAATPAPTATPAPPTPAPTATPAQSNSPYTFNGIPVYTANDWFTTNLVTGGSSYASNAVDPNSAAIINNYTSAMGNPSFNINGSNTTVAQNSAVNLATSSTAQYAVQSCIYGCKNWDGTTQVKIPWQSGFLEAGECTAGDCHDLVLDTSSHLAYDTYGSGRYSWTGSSFTAESAYSHNLSRSYDSQKMGGPDNAGIAYWGTVLMGEDAALPSINHVIAVSIAGTDAGPVGSGGWVSPAIQGSACKTSCTNKLPMGARLRLKSSYACPSASTNPQANKICTTMKTYGIIVIDHNGSGSGGSFGPQMERRRDGTNPWNQTDLQALDGIKLGQFDVMSLGTIH